ncbi:MAG: hypothetical protein KAS73_01835 [Candidatus Sabulitectum sp.]|nr:hypothetical protein [Candidatus Sabulitectum sp.]
MSGSLDTSLFRFYHGRSMRFTFRPGDCIYFKTDSVSDLAAGDVIVFSSEDAGGVDIIHRIVEVGSSFVLTHGDNNPSDQIENVAFSRVLGKAVAYKRKGKPVKPVTGGFCGRVRAVVISKSGVCRVVARWGWAGLRWSRVVRLFWRPSIETMHVETDADSVVRLVCNDKSIGKWCSSRKILVLIKPYDLVVFLKNGELQL